MRISGQDTAEMLHTLHLALRRQPPGADLCTVALVTMRLSGAGAKLHLALAGHQPPFLIDREGRVVARCPYGAPAVTEDGPVAVTAMSVVGSVLLTLKLATAVPQLFVDRAVANSLAAQKVPSEGSMLMPLRSPARPPELKSL